jgi:hypothetical protein
MTWEEMLSEMLGLVGREVMLSAAPLDERGPMISAIGILERGEPSRAQPLMEEMGLVPTGSEAITFHVTPTTMLTLDKARFREAGHTDAPGRGLYIDQAGTLVGVVDVERARADLAQLGVDRD